MELIQDPRNLPNFIPYYLGWDKSGNAGTGGIGIHHPKGDVKKISIDNDPLINYTSNINWYGGSVSQPGTHWKSIIDVGTQEGGSSGSPILNNQHKVIGQLHGGQSGCAPVVKYYGKFNVSWTGNDASDNRRRLDHWLDPNNTGVNTINGQSPFAISGPTTVCSSFNSTFTLNSGATVDWDCSDNIIIVSENTDTCTVHALNSYVSGIGTITANVSISGSCSFTLEKNVWVGKPKTIIESIETEYVTNPEVPDSFPVNSASFKLEPDAYGYINFGAEFFIDQALQWNLDFPPTNVCDVIQYGDHVTLLGRNDGSFFFTMQAENECGNGFPAFVNVTVGDNDNPFPMLLSVSPNPTSDVLSVELSEEQETETAEKIKKQKIDIKLYNNMQIPVYANIKYEKKFDVNVSNLPTGIYQLQVIYKEKKLSKQILIQR